jgi:Flp pilus assembly protein CpaB
MVRAMFLANLKLLAAGLLTLGVAGTGIGWVAMQARGQDLKPATSEKARGPEGKPQSNDEADKSAPLVDVMVTKRPMLAFNPLELDAFYVRQIPAGMGDGWLKKEEVENLVNDSKMLKRSLGKNRPVSFDDVYDPQRDSLRGVLKAGEIAKTIGRAKPLSLSSLIVEGAHVDIELITSTPAKEGQKLLSTILEDVEVLATNAFPGDGTQPAKPADRVTLRLTREQALLLGSFEGAQEKDQGVIRLFPRVPEVKQNPNQPASDCLDEFAQALAQGKRTDEECADAIYLAALGRFPVESEKQQVTKHLAKAADRATALRNVAWVLVNGSEFVTRVEKLNAYELRRK